MRTERQRHNQGQGKCPFQLTIYLAGSLNANFGFDLNRQRYSSHFCIFLQLRAFQHLMLLFFVCLFLVELPYEHFCPKVFLFSLLLPWPNDQILQQNVRPCPFNCWMELYSPGSQCVKCMFVYMFLCQCLISGICLDNSLQFAWQGFRNCLSLFPSQGTEGGTSSRLPRWFRV